MNIIVAVLLLVALVCFGAAALRATARVELVAAGLFFWVLSVLLPALTGL